MLNYNKLRYFYTVAQTLNLTRAAEELYISQSAVSKHMRELEAELGVILFIRTNRDLILTEAGNILFQEIQILFSKEEEILRKVQAAGETNTKELRIGFMGIQPAFHLTSIVNQMLLSDGELKISMKRYNWDEIEPAVKSHKIDLGLRLRMGAFHDSSLDSKILDTAPPALVISERHPAAQKEHATMVDFADDHFLLLSENDSVIPNSYTHELLKKHHIVPKKISVYSQPETILMMIHSDAGISLLSRFAATDQFPDLKVIDVGIDEQMHLELIWRKNDLTPSIQQFIEKMESLYE